MIVEHENLTKDQTSFLNSSIREETHWFQMVYKIMNKVGGTLDKYRVILVAKGFS